MVQRLSHISLGSRNLGRAIDFYQNLLGTEIAHEFRNGAGELYGVFLSIGGGTFLEIFNDPILENGKNCFRHFAIEVDDIEMAASKARDLGLVVEIKRGRTDRILQFHIYDPDGNQVEFQQHDMESALRAFL